MDQTPNTDNLVLPGASFLDEDLSKVDTSMPVIRGGIAAELEIVSVTQEPKKDGTGSNVVIKMKTTRELPSTKGDMINAGYPLTKYLSLSPVIGRTDGKKEYTEDDVRRGLAQFMEAVEGKKGNMNPMERFAGKRVMVKVTVSPGNEQYADESNSIKFAKR